MLDLGFMAGRHFGVVYEFTVPASGRIVLRAEITQSLLLISGNVSVDAGALRYRVFGWLDTSRELEAFDTENPLPVVRLNTMSGVPVVTPTTVITVGGDFDDTGLFPFPVARIRTGGNTNFSQTAGQSPGSQRGFTPVFAYIVLTTLTANECTGVLEYRFEER